MISGGFGVKVWILNMSLGLEGFPLPRSVLFFFRRIGNAGGHGSRVGIFRPSVLGIRKLLIFPPLRQQCRLLKG